MANDFEKQRIMRIAKTKPANDPGGARKPRDFKKKFKAVRNSPGMVFGGQASSGGVAKPISAPSNDTAKRGAGFRMLKRLLGKPSSGMGPSTKPKRIMF
jgi:hypothetical protein